jgi:hypothetical protein
MSDFKFLSEIKVLPNSTQQSIYEELEKRLGKALYYSYNILVNPNYSVLIYDMDENLLHTEYLQYSIGCVLEYRAPLVTYKGEVIRVTESKSMTGHEYWLKTLSDEIYVGYVLAYQTTTKLITQ